MIEHQPTPNRIKANLIPPKNASYEGTTTSWVFFLGQLGSSLGNFKNNSLTQIVLDRFLESDILATMPKYDPDDNKTDARGRKIFVNLFLERDCPSHVPQNNVTKKTRIKRHPRNLDSLCRTRVLIWHAKFSPRQEQHPCRMHKKFW